MSGADGAGGPEIVVLSDAEALASAAADRFCGWAQEAIDARGTAHVALTGGSSASALYLELRSESRRGRIDWPRLHLWWGDERFVPLDHPDSNAGLAIRLLFEPGSGADDRQDALPIPTDQVHAIPVAEAIADGTGPHGAATRYTEMMRAAIERWPTGVPVMDLVLLGLGPDGHILSVFPGSAALDRDAPLVMGIPAPTHLEPHLARVTLTPALVAAAEHVLVMVPGSDKAAIVARVLAEDEAPASVPAVLAAIPSATWLLIEGSAARL